MSNITIDTSAIISVISNEPTKSAIVKAAKGFDLIAPRSVHWEIGNAFSALFKKSAAKLEQALKALTVYDTIPIRFIDIDLADATKLASKSKIYAYDAYVLCCARQSKTSILTLDSGLIHTAKSLDISVTEVPK